METRTNVGELLLRPVFILDQSVFLSYASYIRRIMVGLAGTAQATSLVCPGGIGVESILYPSVEWIEHPALRLPIFHMQNTRILLERLARFKPTILHTFHPGLVHLTAGLAYQLDVPYVVTFHAEPSRMLLPIKHTCDSSRFIAPSAHLAAGLERKWPHLADCIEQIHVGTFIEDQCACFARPSGIPSLIAVHPMDNLKLFLPLLNAVRHLVLDGHELFVALMGTGRAERAVRSHVRKLGLSSIVTIIPPVRPVRNILSGADIYLHLEDRGCFDAQLLEAIAVGLAVAGTTDQTSGLLQQGGSVVWDANDELSIYSCLKLILSNKDTTRRVAAAAQSRLRTECSVSQMVDRLVETYFKAQKSYKQRFGPADEELAPTA